MNTTIGAAGLRFQSISSDLTNTTYGIDLDDTGTSGSLTVTGTGAPGSGGGDDQQRNGGGHPADTRPTRPASPT